MPWQDARALVVGMLTACMHMHVHMHAYASILLTLSTADGDGLRTFVLLVQAVVGEDLGAAARLPAAEDEHVAALELVDHQRAPVVPHPRCPRRPAPALNST